jgi:NADH-quinone oxidoreductase subunit J
MNMAMFLQDPGLWLIGLVTVAFAMLAVTVKDLVHAVLWLGMALLGTAALFAKFDASFLAAIQVLLYVGGVVVLLIFGVMLTRNHEHLAAFRQTRRPVRAAVVAVALFVALVHAILNTPGLNDAPAGKSVSLQDLGLALLGPYAFAFEVLSLLLLAAMVGAVVLARKRDPGQPSAKKLIRHRNLGRQVVEGLAATDEVGQ